MAVQLSTGGALDSDAWHFRWDERLEGGRLSARRVKRMQLASGSRLHFEGGGLEFELKQFCSLSNSVSIIAHEGGGTAARGGRRAQGGPGPDRRSVDGGTRPPGGPVSLSTVTAPTRPFSRDGQPPRRAAPAAMTRSKPQ